MNEERIIAPATVTVRESSLFDAVCVALESGEFTQVRERMSGGSNGRCAWGVMRTTIRRAGAPDYAAIHPRIFEIERRAGQLLGYDGIESANDAGEHFGIIAAALRAARQEIEDRAN
jgi:hypothetical protein